MNKLQNKNYWKTLYINFSPMVVLWCIFKFVFFFLTKSHTQVSLSIGKKNPPKDTLTLSREHIYYTHPKSADSYVKVEIA